jgi:transaldolase / glucose-6-phosphate isomerase
MATIKELQNHGQAVWLDFLARGFIAKGELKKLVDEGVRGVTSNPSIFEKAIGGTAEYDEQLTALIKQGDRTVGDLYEASCGGTSTART